MKCLRVTGNAAIGNYNVFVVGENQMKVNEDTHDTLMQVLRLRMRWDIIDDQIENNNVFDYTFPITF